MEAFSQENQTKSDGWFLLLNHYKINDDWKVGNEFHYRRTDFFKTDKQLIIRPFVSFQPGETAEYTFGYSYLLGSTDFSEPSEAFNREHNFWEQITLHHKARFVDISHRFRVEHRFQKSLNNKKSANKYQLENRFRYRLTLRRNIAKNWFLHIFDELWVSTNREFKFPTYDRNWVYLGVGYNLTEKGNIQVAYLHQNTRINNEQYLINPTLQFTFQYDFN